jgi:hypothetical protein
MEFHVAVCNYDVIYIKGECRIALWISRVLCGYELENEYKDECKLRPKIMEWSSIYGYVSFGLGLLFLLGLIRFTWMALHKIQGHPVQWVFEPNKGMALFWTELWSEGIVRIWLEPLPERSAPSAIVFLNPTFICLTPFVFWLFWSSSSNSSWSEQVV